LKRSVIFQASKDKKQQSKRRQKNKKGEAQVVLKKMKLVLKTMKYPETSFTRLLSIFAFVYR